MIGKCLCYFGWHHPVVEKNQFVAIMAKLLATDHPGGKTLVVDAYCKRCRKPMKRWYRLPESGLPRKRSKQ